MRFGVTEHVERAYSWFNTNKGADAEGPMAGVPYDGNNPEHSDFYFPPHDDANPQYPVDPPDWWCKQWSDRIIDVLDTYEPDLLYTDGAVPFGEVGRKVLAHFYNQNAARRGSLEAVYNLKSYQISTHAQLAPSVDEHGNRKGGHGDYVEGIGILDLERGGVDRIWPVPWQTDTCVGGWFYDEGRTYKSPRLIVHMLADIVSKNGNMLLNFPGRADGTLDDPQLAILDGLADWFAINAEGIHGTRPWTRYGQGKDFPTGDFAEPNESPLGFGDYRFVTKGDALYAIAMGWPEPQQAWTLEALGDRRVDRVELLGHGEPLSFERRGDAVTITPPARRPASDLAYVLKLS
ncbi:MAG: alpha-L-fucosidase [Planctomycetota bacterium]